MKYELTKNIFVPYRNSNGCMGLFGWSCYQA